MSHNIVIELHGPSQRAYGHRMIDMQPDGTVLIFGEKPRTNDQSKLMWSRLQDFANQVPWKAGGVTDFITKEEWKDVFTSALEQDMRVADGLRGGIVLVGKRTSTMSKSKMIQLLDLIKHEGDERQLVWSPTSIGREAVPA